VETRDTQVGSSEAGTAAAGVIAAFTRLVTAAVPDLLRAAKVRAFPGLDPCLSVAKFRAWYAQQVWRLCEEHGNPHSLTASQVFFESQTKRPPIGKVVLGQEASQLGRGSYAKWFDTGTCYPTSRSSTTGRKDSPKVGDFGLDKIQPLTLRPAADICSTETRNLSLNL